MKRAIPVFVMAAGVLLILAGFFYDVVFAGIPYQDPTPELAAGYARHADTAACMYRSGAAVFVAGLVATLIQIVMARRRKSGS